MNKGTLPVIARLQALQDHARFAEDGARLIADGSDRNPVAAMLREVNETVLSRLLTFDTVDGPSLTVEVAGRRVLRMTAASSLTGAESCLAAPSLEDAHKDALISLMQAVARRGHDLRVTVGPIGHDSDGLSVGLPVALLADLLLIDLNHLSQKTPAAAHAPIEDEAQAEATTTHTQAAQAEGLLSRFAKGSGPALIAWLIVGGHEDGATDGSEEMVDHLRAFLEDEGEALAAQLDRVSDQPDSAVCVILGATLAEGHSILCARAAGGVLLGVVDGDATRGFLAGWVAALAQH